MGVIDLDKRVKKLEQDGVAGAADLDQLESAVTAIENELTLTTTDISDDLILPETCTGTATIRTYGKLAVLDITITATADSTEVTEGIYTIPETMRATCDWDYFVNPLAVIDANFTYYVSENVLTPAFSTDLSTGESVVFSAMWLIDPPAPEPTPGE